MIRSLALLFLTLMLSACDQQAWFDKMIPQEEAEIGKKVISQLAARDYGAIESQLVAELKTPQLRGQLKQMAQMLPAESPKSVKTVGTQTFKTTDLTNYHLTYEYEYAQAWIIASTSLQRRGGKLVLTALHVLPQDQSLITKNRFTIEGKGPAHYTVLAMAVAIPLFVVFALVICIRTPIAKRKWLWVLFVALGFAQFQFNWTDGAWGIQPLSFLLLGAGFTKAGPAAPYIFALAFPLGAVIFLAKRRSFVAQAQVASNAAET
ncbi:hypothetical protein ACO2Q9_18910 [Variovorax sp. VNK109]|uniref:hypothetical protein n=1 Tax=Variovorax sp. VNK109 TaxID=3400919 RepID=UPI003C01989E